MKNGWIPQEERDRYATLMAGMTGEQKAGAEIFIRYSEDKKFMNQLMSLYLNLMRHALRGHKNPDPFVQGVAAGQAMIMRSIFMAVTRRDLSEAKSLFNEPMDHGRRIAVCPECRKMFSGEEEFRNNPDPDYEGPEQSKLYCPYCDTVVTDNKRNPVISGEDSNEKV